MEENKEELKILFEDNHIIVALKPRGVPSQGDSTGDKDMTAIVKDYLKIKYQKLGNVYLGLVHRLDRPTGGVMVFAKTDKAAGRLSKQIAAGEIEKRYFAVVCGTPRDKRGRIRSFLTKDERSNIVTSHVGKVEGSKEAVLDYKVLDGADGITLLDINLLTGRSHQARVQLASVCGTPIYGDVKYGKSTVSGAGRHLGLWAYSLSFTHPVSGENMSFKAFPPVDEYPYSLFSFDKHLNISKPE